MVIQVGVLLSGPQCNADERPETCGAQRGFNEGVLPQDLFCTRDLLGCFPPSGGAKESLLIVSESSRQTPILLPLRLAAEVGQNYIPQVEGGLVFVAICSTLSSGPPFSCFPGRGCRAQLTSPSAVSLRFNSLLALTPELAVRPEVRPSGPEMYLRTYSVTS